MIKHNVQVVPILKKGRSLWTQDIIKPVFFLCVCVLCFYSTTAAHFADHTHCHTHFWSIQHKVLCDVQIQHACKHSMTLNNTLLLQVVPHNHVTPVTSMAWQDLAHLVEHEERCVDNTIRQLLAGKLKEERWHMG